MNKALTAIFIFSVLAGCSMLNGARSIEKTLISCTAQPWHGGVKGSGRGITFRMKFYKLNEPLVADTLWINKNPYTTEITKVGDTTYVSSFYFTEKEGKNEVINAEEFTGKLGVQKDEHKIFIGTKPFEKLPIISYQ